MPSTLYYQNIQFSNKCEGVEVKYSPLRRYQVSMELQEKGKYIIK